MVSVSLEGIRVGVPAHRRATETAELIRRRGGEPIVGPLVEEVPEGDGVLRPQTQEVLAERPRWSVHLTGVGTRMWLDRAEGWGVLDDLLDVLREATVVARGPKARKALGERDVEPDWMPSSETSREIGEWLGERIGDSDAVAVQLYGKPARVLLDAIADAGGRAIEVTPYRWDIPPDRGPAEDLCRAICAGDVDALVVTSAPQVENLFRLAEELGCADELREVLRERVFCAAVGVVARRGFEDAGVEADLVPDSARVGTLVRALADARDAILAKSGRAG